MALPSDPGLTDENSKQTVHPESTITVLIAEQMEVLRFGLCRFVESSSDFHLAGETATREDLTALSGELKPHVMILDAHLADIGGLETATLVKDESPETQVIIYSESERIEDVRAALDTSVRGYLLKQASFDEIDHAIRQVHAGQDYISEDLANQLLKSMQTGYSVTEAPNNRDLKLTLTPRENEILARLRTGHTNNEIAVELNLAEKTVKHHLTSIYRKFDVHSRAQAICVANEQRFD